VLRIGLYDLDATGFPNLALMKLSTWHKAQGDDVRLLRRFNADVDKAYGSAVFSWNRPKADWMAARGVVVGGSGVSLASALPPEVEACRPDYALYGINYGMGYLMRGCIWTCAFCIVPKKEGKPREVASIDELVNYQSERKPPFVVLLDNEFFWREKWAIEQLEQFTKRGIDFCASQGLDIRVVTPPLVKTLAASPYWNLHHTARQLTFAFDDIRIERQYRRGVEMLLAAGIPPKRLQSFVLVGFNSTIEQDLRRIQIIRSYGADPFVMLYRDAETGAGVRDRERRNLARWVNRRLYKVCEFTDYRPEKARRLQPFLAPAPEAPVRAVKRATA